MNVLIEKMPTIAEIDGIDYELDADFRTVLKIMLAFEDMKLTKQERILVMLRLLFKDNIPKDIKKASETASTFLNCGNISTGGESEQEQRVFSFEKDASYIYTAINQTYNTDLETVPFLHWWKFCYMFRDLKEDCFFTKLVDLRNRKNKGKLSKEEKEYCYKIKDIIDLPQTRTVEEIEAENEFMRLLGEK